MTRCKARPTLRRYQERLHAYDDIAAASIGTIITATGFAVPAASAVALPGVVVDYATTAVVVKIKPKTIQPFKDLYYTGLHWTKLTGSVGYATGTRHINTCMPSCADANYINDQVAMKFTRVRTAPKHQLIFSQVQVTVVDTHSLPVSGF